MAPEMPGPAVLRLLPEPERPYARLRDDLVALGWEWANESQELPLVPGEPEWVAYRHPSGAVLEYEYFPPVALRTVVASGTPDALAPLTDLPHLDPDDLEVLLAAPYAETVVRGLLGVQALVWVPLLATVREIVVGHDDPVVRRVAADVAERLPELAAAELHRWQEHRVAHPDRSVLLAMMPIDDRRQVLRWMGADGRRATPGVLEALRTGLEDDDAEVRATAAIVAARLGAADLVEAVDALAVPDVLVGPVATARAALHAGRRLVVDEPRDEETLLAYALAEPVVDVPLPSSLPAHLSGERGVRLRMSGLAVALVPAIEHWLHGRGRPERVRQDAFVVTAAPVQLATARLLGLQASGADEDPFVATEAEAEELAARVAALEGVPVGLTSRERWEAALRGPDGRRFTAGNVEPGVAMSCWGALAVPGVAERLAHGLAADPGDLATARPASPDERLPLRLALRFPL